MILAVWTLTVQAHYYNNVRVNDTPVRCLAQDENNYVWLGTGSGLYCYDGYRCSPKYTISEAMRATVYCLKADGHILYVGTSKGFYVFDTNTYMSDQPRQETKEVRALEIAADGVLVGKPDGLWRYNPGTNQLHQLDASVRDIYALEHISGQTFIGALKGFYCYKSGKMEEIVLRQGERPYVNSLLADEQRRCLWIGAGDMLYQYDLKSGHVSEISELDGVSVKSMSLAENGTLYIATDNGFYTYSAGVLSLDRHDSRNPHSLSDNVVWSTFIDHLGNIVLGTDDGLSVINAPSYYSYQPVSLLTGKSDGSKISSLLVDSMGRKWFGGNNGLIMISPTARRWYRQVDKDFPITHNRIRQIYEDLTGNIWIATDNGINLYDEATGQMRNIVVTDKKGEYTARWAYDILDDGQGNMWIAAFSGGIFITSKEKLLNNEGIIVADRYIGANKDGLSDLWVRQLKKDTKGNIWARTGKGLDCINISTKKVVNILNTAPGCILADKDGNIWVANPEELLCYTNSNLPRKYLYGKVQADFETVALCDVNRQIWVVTPKECILIGDDGNNQRLRIPVINACGAYYSANDKSIYIGGQDGLVTMYPSEINDNSRQRRIALTEILVNGEQRLIENGGITLNHNENNIELKLTDFPYLGDVMTSYFYHLDGVDNVWHIMSSLENPIVYNALPYGKYTLRIRGINGTDGQEKELFVTNIQILPPWYLSMWAKILYVLIILGFILWMVRFYIVRKELYREQQEKQHLLEQSKTRMDFYNNMSRNLKNALRHVMAPLSEMVAQDIEGQQEKISDIRSHTALMNTLIRKAFDMGNIEDVKSDVPLNRINIVAFCRETLKSVQSVANEQNIQLKLKSDAPSVLVQTDVLRLDSALSVLLQNMLKHTEAEGVIAVNINTDSQTNKVYIRVNSSSMDVPENLRPYLFQRYRQQDDEDLYLAKEYIEELGGKIMVDSGEKAGTTFKVTFDILSDKPVSSPLVTEEKPSEKDEIISEKDEKLMHEITRAIEANLIDSDFNVTRLQETVGIGQKLLYRKIKQITGVTPVEYIRNIRIEKAARLLREGKFSISEVMYMVGFTKSGYFSKCFQEAFGMTPSAYIKKTNIQ